MTVPPDDRGLLLGDGLFETLLARGGALEHWEAHFARLRAGCADLGLPAPDGAAALRLCEQAVADAGLSRAAVRLTLTAGSGGRGLDRPAQVQTRMIATASASSAPTGPAQLVTVGVRRNEHSPASRLKTLSYLDSVLARREAGGAEALMLNTVGQIACAAAANLFWVQDGRLQTPALECGVLDGIMRGVVIARARARGIAVEEVRVDRAALDGATGLFLTNSLIGVRPVSMLDGQAVAESPLVARISSSW